jgi:hypothetical protein
LVLEFFVADRHPFTNSLTAVAIPEPVAVQITGPIIYINASFIDYRIPGDPRYVIEFTNSIPGRTYTIEYGTNNVTWIPAVPSIVASANWTQWYDDGPPETISKPFTTNSPVRFYQVILDP